MLEYAETASLEYWKKRILSLNHKDLTDDNVIIGFNLSPEQRNEELRPFVLTDALKAQMLNLV